MSRRRCSNCIFRSACDEHKVCEDFSPIDDDMDDYHVGRSIRSRREEFLADWNEYVMDRDGGENYY